MDARHLAVVVLLALAALVVALSGLGLVATSGTVARLHFLTPVSSIAAPLTGIGYLVDQGIGLASGLVLGIVALVAFTGPPLGTAIARVAAREEGLLAPGTPGESEP